MTDVSSLKTFWLKHRRSLTACVITALLLILSYPKFNVSLLAFIAFAPLTPVLQNQSRGQKVLFCWLTGFIFYCGILYWIVPTCIVGGLNAALAVLALILLSAIIALSWAAFGFLCSFIKNANGLKFALLCACAWVITEWLFMLLSQYGCWFPWFMLGYTQWKFIALIQTANLTGAFGISFLVIFFGMGLGLFMQSARAKKDALRLLGLPALLIIICCAYGLIYMQATKNSKGEELTVSLVQPNIDQYKKWDAAFVTEIEDTMALMLNEAARNKPDLILWPESSFPNYIEHYALLLKKADTYQVVGAYSKTDNKHVSAYLFNPGADIIAAYNKRVLVPFGEFVPLKSVLGKYIGVLNQMGSFNKGAAKQEPFVMRSRDTGKPIILGPTICYETIFPFLWRSHAKDGAALFINSTNDGWYLNTAAPYQHFAVTALRAAEFSIPAARATNTGISAFINRYGMVTFKTKLNEEAVVLGGVNAKNVKTFYALAGNLFSFICLVFYLITILRTRKA